MSTIVEGEVGIPYGIGKISRNEMAFSFVPLVCTIEDIWVSDLSLSLGAHASPNQLLQLEWILKEENDLI